ncbi:hypothetical protein AMTR_s00043p00213130 [Amborella trichopoda]|uniref:Retrotransposon gag domain-containing protein n=1 Tax=Amborella trichopoda TaxID=13333 RepID=W1PS05_AMBTC|nr:hypothetical protein AMTR_s00043p00213130 [Amborella trichopoda]
MVSSRPIFKPLYQFYNPQPREAPSMAPTYLPLHQQTPLNLADQLATLGSNPWRPTGDAITWYNEFVRDYPKASSREMFKRFIAHFGTKKPQSITVGELVSLKQGPDEPFTDFVDRFNDVASKVKECPLLDHAKTNMILENVNNERRSSAMALSL